jgi:hypothetical protein
MSKLYKTTQAVHMALDKDTLDALKKRLPRGYVRLAQQRLERRRAACSQAHISNVINGLRYDKAVVEALIEVAEQHERDLKAIAERARGKVAA